MAEVDLERVLKEVVGVIEGAILVDLGVLKQ